MIEVKVGVASVLAVWRMTHLRKGVGSGAHYRSFVVPTLLRTMPRLPFIGR